MTQVAISSIQSMIAPAVLMTTAAILAGGVQTMYSAINDRMRDMTTEKLVRYEVDRTLQLGSTDSA